MADYERLVKELNAKLQGRDECAEELKAQINTLTQKEDTLKQEIGMFVLHKGLVMVASKCKDHLSKYPLRDIISFFGHLKLSACIYVCVCVCVNVDVCSQRF